MERWQKEEGVAPKNVNVVKSTLGNTKPFPLFTVLLFVALDEASINAELLVEVFVTTVNLTWEYPFKIDSKVIIKNIFFTYLLI